MGYGIISPRNYFAGGQETNCRINNLIYQAAKAGRRISLWFVNTKDYKGIERELRASDPPEWNRIQLKYIKIFLMWYNYFCKVKGGGTKW